MISDNGKIWKIRLQATSRGHVFFDAAAIQQLWQPFEPICTKALEIFRSLGPDGVQLP